MKLKLSILGIIVIVSVLIIVGCKKETNIDLAQQNEQASTNEIKAEVMQGVLAFSSVEDYDAAINKVAKLLKDKDLKAWKSRYVFESLYDVYDKFEKCPVNSEVLALILNKDFKVIIDHFEYTIDTKKEIVILNDLTNSKYSNEQIFSFEENVIEHVHHGDELTKGCSQCTYVDAEYTQWTNEGDIFMETEYNRYGIYYDLVYHWNGEGISSFSNVDIQISDVHGEYSKCRSSKLTEYSDPGIYTNYNSGRIRVYQSMKRLDQIHAYGKYTVYDIDSNGNRVIRCNRYLNIMCH
jgi:hypothetical protein